MDLTRHTSKLRGKNKLLPYRHRVAIKRYIKYRSIYHARPERPRGESSIPPRQEPRGGGNARDARCECPPCVLRQWACTTSKDARCEKILSRERETLVRAACILDATPGTVTATVADEATKRKRERERLLETSARGPRETRSRRQRLVRAPHKSSSRNSDEKERESAADFHEATHGMSTGRICRSRPGLHLPALPSLLLIRHSPIPPLCVLPVFHLRHPAVSRVRPLARALSD